MSKYLRTKDNLYEIESSFFDYKGKTIYQTVKNGIIDETEVDKVADNFDELCDKFLMVLNDRFDKPGVVNSLESAKDIIKVEPRFDCYGCIGTSKGLIYKAKLNKKSGVFELYENN